MSEPSSGTCSNKASHPPHLLVVKQTPLDVFGTQVTHIRSCVSDISDPPDTGIRQNETPNHTVEFNITCETSDLRSVKKMNIIAPSIVNFIPLSTRRSPESIEFQFDNDPISADDGRSKTSVLFKYPPVPSMITENTSQGQLRFDGSQYVPWQSHRPSLNSKALKLLDQESKNMLSPLLNGNLGRRNDRYLTLVSVECNESNDTQRVVWNMKLHYLHSNQPPEPSVWYWKEGPEDEDEDEETWDIPPSEALRLAATAPIHGTNTIPWNVEN